MGAKDNKMISVIVFVFSYICIFRMFLITAKNTAIYKQTKKEFNGHYPAGYICFLVLGIMLMVMNNAKRETENMIFIHNLSFIIVFVCLVLINKYAWKYFYKKLYEKNK